MKRSQEHSQASTSQAAPAAKKLKVAPPESPAVTASDDPSADADADNGWTKVEKRKAKKVRKIEGKLDAKPARFMYNKAEILRRREAVNINDIRDLVLHVACDAPPPGWVRVENPRSIQKLVVLLVPGLTPEVLSLPPLPTAATSNPNLPLEIPLPDLDATQDMPFIARTFSHACPTLAPGDQTRMHSVLGGFFQCPVSGEEKKRRLTERLASERAQQKSPMRYIMTKEQMVENEYPVPSYTADTFEKTTGWVETPQHADDSSLPAKLPRIFCIDCEMCQTEDGKELTRVCILDYESGVVIYDKLVKPHKTITDYLTRWSGITAEALAGVTTTFEEVQAQILALLSVSPTPVLLGHSLESDLKALKICHPKCIDTAVLYNHPRGRPFKPGLAWLTKKWCGREIQNRGEGGHDPEEDARACLDLLKKKVENGPGFGEFKIDMESIFERLGRARNGAVSSIVVDHGNPAAWHGSKATTVIACKSDDEVLDGLLDSIPSHTFAFGRFTGLADTLGWITNKATGELLADAPPPTPIQARDAGSALADLNSRLSRLYEALPPRTAFIVFTGHSDPRKMVALNTRKNTFEAALRSGKGTEDLEGETRWTTADSRALEEEVERAKRGLLFLGIKDAK